MFKSFAMTTKPLICLRTIIVISKGFVDVGIFMIPATVANWYLTSLETLARARNLFAHFAVVGLDNVSNGFCFVVVQAEESKVQISLEA